MDIYDNFVSVGEIYCDGCAALFVITMYVRLLTWSKHNLTRLDCWPPITRKELNDHLRSPYFC